MTSRRPAHDRAEPLDWNGAVAALDALSGRHVAVRVVLDRDPEELIAVVPGPLGRRSASKAPAMFWSIAERCGNEMEERGLYLREREFTFAERRSGGVLIVGQGAFLLNVRPLRGV